MSKSNALNNGSEFYSALHKCDCIKDEKSRVTCKRKCYEDRIKLVNDEYTAIIRKEKETGEEVDSEIHNGYLAYLNLLNPILRNLEVDESRL